jgi:hypothetical protein
VHAAVLMVSMPTAVQVGPMRVAVHVPMVVVVAPRIMYLAVFVISISLAIEMPPIRIAMHVPMMVAVAVIPIDVNALRLLHNASLAWGGWTNGCRLGCSCR